MKMNSQKNNTGIKIEVKNIYCSIPIPPPTP